MTIEYPGDEPAVQPAPADRRLGFTAVVLAAGFGVIVGIAVAAAAEGDHATGTALAWFAIVGTVFTLALGISAVVLHRGRRWGVVAVILSLIVNPWILTQILSFFATLTAS
jgi:hypothetical protein